MFRLVVYSYLVIRSRRIEIKGRMKNHVDYCVMLFTLGYDSSSWKVYENGK
jgi:hypothetical protein